MYHLYFALIWSLQITGNYFDCYFFFLAPEYSYCESIYRRVLSHRHDIPSMLQVKRRPHQCLPTPVQVSIYHPLVHVRLVFLWLWLSLSLSLSLSLFLSLSLSTLRPKICRYWRSVVSHAVCRNEFSPLYGQHFVLLCTAENPFAATINNLLHLQPAVCFFSVQEEDLSFFSPINFSLLSPCLFSHVREMTLSPTCDSRRTTGSSVQKIRSKQRKYLGLP